MPPFLVNQIVFRFFLPGQLVVLLMAHQKLNKLSLHVRVVCLLGEEFQSDCLVSQLLRLMLQILERFQKMGELLRPDQVLVLERHPIFSDKLLENYGIRIWQQF